MFNAVSRKGLKIRQQTSSEIVPGTIARYRGSIDRLKEFLLIHEINPEYTALKNADGSPQREHDMVKAEVLKPENGYCDYCLFWVEKKPLTPLNEKEYREILAHLI